MRHYALCTLVLSALASLSHAIPASPHAFTATEPDGTVINLKIVGDEESHHHCDLEGYTVVTNAQGYHVYATEDLLPSSLRVGQANPRAHGIPRGLRTAKPTPPSRSLRGGESRAHPRALAPSTGTLVNVVVLMRFADHATRNLPTQTEIAELFNADPADATFVNSVKRFYTINSFGALTLNSVVLDWVDMPFTEAQYANGVSGLNSALANGIEDAVALSITDARLTAAGITDFSSLDQDGDGFIDAWAVLHSGFGAEFGGEIAGAAEADRIWSHRRVGLPFSTSATIFGQTLSFNQYHISPSVWGRSSDFVNPEIGRIGVIVHETGHSFDLPDLYDTAGTGEGIGNWGVMASAWGFDGSQFFPGHFSAWTKVQLGWVTPVELSPSSTIIDAPSGNENPVVYIIRDGFPNTDNYLLIENRQNILYDQDASSAHAGLAIFQIDDSADFSTEGYPGQTGWPGNGDHYRVALLQADGDYDLERNQNRGDNGDLYNTGDVLSPSTVPSSDAYQFGATENVITIVSSGTDGGNVQFTFTKTAPSAVTALTAAPGTTTVDLSWEHDGTATGFVVSGSITGGTAETIATLTDSAARSTTVSAIGATSLTEGTSYTFSVVATGDIANSDPASITTTTLITLGAVTGLASTPDIFSISLTWDAVASAASYDVEYRVDGDDALPWTVTIASTNAITISSLVSNTAYDVRVRAAANPASDGAGPYTEVVVTTNAEPTAPLAPTSPSFVVGATPRTIIVSWVWSYTAIESDPPTSFTITDADSAETLAVTADGDARLATIVLADFTTTYNLEITADNSAGSSPAVALAVLTGDPPTPTVPVLAVVCTSFTCSLSWTHDAVDTLAYTLEISTDSGSTYSALGTVSATDPAEFLADSLTALTTYFFRIRADGFGDAVPSAYDEASATTLSALAAPVPSATATTYNSLEISWTDVTDATAYALTYAVTGSGDIPIVDTAATSPYTITSLAAATSYTVTLVATAADREDSAIGSDDFVTSALPAPAAPTDVAVVADSLTLTSVGLSWTNPNPDDLLTTFAVTFVDAAGATQTISDIIATTVTITGLSSDTSYSFVVSAVNAAGSADAAAFDVTTPRVTAPQDLELGSVTAVSIGLSWTHPEAETVTFTAEISLNEADTWTAGVVDGLSTTFTGLTPETSYDMRVLATDIATSEVSSFGTIAGTSTLALSVPEAPTDLSAATPEASQVVITWTDNSATESGFRIYRTIVDSGSPLESTLDVAADVTTFVNDGVSASLTYQYRVVAFNDAGLSPSSNLVTILPSGPSADTVYTASEVSCNHGTSTGNLADLEGLGDGTVIITEEEQASRRGSSDKLECTFTVDVTEAGVAAQLSLSLSAGTSTDSEKYRVQYRAIREDDDDDRRRRRRELSWWSSRWHTLAFVNAGETPDAFVEDLTDDFKGRVQVKITDLRRSKYDGLSLDSVTLDQLIVSVTAADPALIPAAPTLDTAEHADGIISLAWTSDLDESTADGFFIRWTKVEDEATEPGVSLQGGWWWWDEDEDGDEGEDESGEEEVSALTRTYDIEDDIEAGVWDVVVVAFNVHGEASSAAIRVTVPDFIRLEGYYSSRRSRVHLEWEGGSTVEGDVTIQYVQQDTEPDKDSVWTDYATTRNDGGTRFRLSLSAITHFRLMDAVSMLTSNVITIDP